MVRGRKEVDQHLLSNQKTRSHHHHHETVNWAPGPVGPILSSIHSAGPSRAVKFVDFSFFLFPFFPIFPSRGTRRTGRRRWISRFPRNEPVKLSLDEMWTKWPVCGATQASCLSPWRTSLRNFIIPFSLLCFHPPSLSTWSTFQALFIGVPIAPAKDFRLQLTLLIIFLSLNISSVSKISSAFFSSSVNFVLDLILWTKDGVSPLILLPSIRFSTSAAVGFWSLAPCWTCRWVMRGGRWISSPRRLGASVWRRRILMWMKLRSLIWMSM